MARIRGDVKAIEEYLVSCRRHFHQYPETAFEEVKTAEFILNELKQYPELDIKTGVAKTGLVIELRGGATSKTAKTVGLRADMDALPIQTTVDAPYRSKHDGKHHACGHDGHMACMLGAIKILYANRHRINGTVRILFQPAEEGGVAGGGAVQMVEQGAVKNLDEIYGLHLWNWEKFPRVAVDSGPVMAASDRFTVSVVGKGGHGAAPHTSVDPVVISAQLITTLQSVVSRNVNPFDTAVLTIGKINGGYAPNVIADTVEMEGTVRTMKEEVQDMVIERMSTVCKHVGEAAGARIDLDYRRGYPQTVNNEEKMKVVLKAARKITDNAGPPQKTMAGEDMSYFLREVPGCFFFVGSSPSADGAAPLPHHCPEFDIDEQSLLMGCSVLVQIIEDVMM